MKYLWTLSCLVFILGAPTAMAQEPAAVETIDFCGSKWPKDSLEVRCDVSYRQGQPIFKPADMDALLSFTLIQKLYLKAQIPESLAPRLKELKDVQVLHLEDAMLKNVIPMMRMRRLKELVFTGTAPLDFRPLRKLTTLRRLSIERSGAPRSFSLKQFTKIKRLEHFSLKLRSKFPIDLRPLKRMKTLKSLELKGRSKNKKAIASLRRLTSLTLSYLPKRKVLRRLSGLEELIVTHNPKVTSLKALYDLKKLKILDITGTGVSRLELHRFRKRFPNVDIRGCAGEDPKSPCAFTGSRRGR